jgi:hypothetical protein
VEPRIDAFVLVSGGQGYPCTPEGSGSSCHVTDDFVSLGMPPMPPGQEIESYVRDVMVLNSIPYVGQNRGGAFLFQFSRTDPLATPSSVRALVDAVHGSTLLKWYGGGHTLGCVFSLTLTSCPASTDAYVSHRVWLEEHV